MQNTLRLSHFPLVFVTLCWLALSAAGAFAAEIDRFVGTYSGTVDVTSASGETSSRDMSVTISEEKKGFAVAWSTVTNRADGSSKAKKYEINFTPSERESVFAAAMQRNVFGKEVPLNPMEGEPYVWARILGDTLSVYSLFVTPEGGYEIQQFDRTLAEGGLQLEFQNVSNGEIARKISTFLEKQ